MATTQQNHRLAGKAVVITGAGRGLGRAYAVDAAGHGAAVVVNDVDSDAAGAVAAEITDAGGRAVTNTESVADWSGAQRLIASCVERFGTIDGLVNNAGTFAVCAPTEIDEATVASLVQVNLVGAIHAGVHAMTAMLAQGSGSIVNITSGEQCGGKGMAVYGAAKGGVASLTYGWAIDTEGTGVRVNAVSPNAHTRMAATYDAYYGGGGRTQNIGQDPAGNAPIVSYLLADRSAHLTGQVVRIENGWLTLMTHPARLAPAVGGGPWTVDTVADAVDGPLAGYRQPVGMCSVEPG